jgi:hypothetical protein
MSIIVFRYYRVIICWGVLFISSGKMFVKIENSGVNLSQPKNLKAVETLS